MGDRFRDFRGKIGWIEIGILKLGFWNCIDTIGDKVSGVIETVEMHKSKRTDL